MIRISFHQECNNFDTCPTADGSCKDGDIEYKVTIVLSQIVTICMLYELYVGTTVIK